MDEIFLYLVTCHVSGKQYVGMTRESVWERWLAHKRAARNGEKWSLARALRKYGEDAFSIMHIASSTNRADACEVERALIAQYKTHGGSGYNQTAGGDGGLTALHTDEWRALMSKKLKGRKFTAEHRAKISEGIFRSWTPERRAAHSAMRKRLLSVPEARRKLSEAKQRVMTAEYKAKISAAHRGRKQSPEHLQKLSAARRGRVLSEEHKKKIQVSCLWRSKMCYLTGGIYAQAY